MTGIESEEVIKIVLADDHRIIRDGIRAMLEGEGDICIVGEADSGEVLPGVLRAHPANVVLLDINLPGIKGPEVCRKILEEFPETRVLVLSMHRSALHIRQMLHAGAVGYLLKESGAEEVRKAIQAVARGESYFSSKLSDVVVEDATGATGSVSESELRLTRREMEIIRLIAEEYTTKEIADKLFISQRTVDTHRRNLMKKLGVKNTAGLVRFAVTEGIVL